MRLNQYGVGDFDIIKGDCKYLFEVLYQRSSDISIDTLMLDIRCWADKFSTIRFSWSSRESNQIADKLANMAMSQQSDTQVILYLPTCLLNDL